MEMHKSTLGRPEKGLLLVLVSKRTRLMDLANGIRFGPMYRNVLAFFLDAATPLAHIVSNLKIYRYRWGF
jgi:hypothetical protein